jgi:hypothetical protein
MINYNTPYCIDGCFSCEAYKEHFDMKLKQDLLSTNDILRNMKSDLRKHIMSNRSNHTINCMLRSMTNLNIIEVSIKSKSKL